MSPEDKIDAHQILFGLNREEDERSLADFLRLFSEHRLTSVLIPRMTDKEISQTVERLTAILRNHLSEKEYHALFLGQPR
jgi:TorA maturation chaperone TorD